MKAIRQHFRAKGLIAEEKKLRYVKSVTAQQIIEAIKRLDPTEQLGVIRFAYKLDAERQLSGDELSKLAARMTETDDAVEAAAIRESIVRGFYGAKTGDA